MKHILHYILMLLLFQGVSSGQGDILDPTVDILSSKTTVKAGEPFKVTFRVVVPAEHHIYYRYTGGIEMAAEFPFTESDQYTVGKIQWPTPHTFIAAAGTELAYRSYSYGEGVHYFTTEITPSANLKTGDTLNIETPLFIQICKKKCGLFTPTLTLKLPVANESIDNDQVIAELSKAESHLPTQNDAWKFQAQTKDGNLVFTIDSPIDLTQVKDLIFVPDANYILPKGKNTIVKSGDQYTLTVKHAENHEIGDKVTGVLTNIHGHLSDDISGIIVEAPIVGEVAVAKEVHRDHNDKGFLHNVETFTKAQKDKHSELYNGEEKINYVTLDQAKELIASGSISEGVTKVEKVSQTIVTVMFFAFIGGMILNLMPCVFPVLGLKVMGFAQMAGNEPKKIKYHGLVFAFGVIVSMWVLAAVILGVREALEKAGEGTIQWGAQMQNPIFVALIILLLFIMGLNMYGVFEIGTKLTSAGGDLQNKKGYSGSFFSGILTTLIATPCSGPFLGAAMSYTLGLPALEAMLVFTVFALGISFPYIALAFMPALINKLPRPGAWMEVLKKFMAFPLFATAVFFLGTFGALTGVDGMFWLAMAMVLFGMAAWAYGTWSVPYMKKSKRYIWGFALPLVIVITASFFTYSAWNKEADVKEGWHAGVVEHHLSKKRIVWVDYTADW